MKVLSVKDIIYNMFILSINKWGKYEIEYSAFTDEIKEYVDFLIQVQQLKLKEVPEINLKLVSPGKNFDMSKIKENLYSISIEFYNYDDEYIIDAIALINANSIEHAIEIACNSHFTALRYFDNGAIKPLFKNIKRAVVLKESAELFKVLRQND